MEDEIQLTQEKIVQYRAELADNADALAALDVIEKRKGNLANATESLAIRKGIEGVKDNADLRWFFILLNKCREHICQPKYEDLRKQYLPAIIPPLTAIIAELLLVSSGVAVLLATPVAIYIQEKGIDKFCQTSTDS